MHAGERVPEKALWLLLLYVFSSTWACPMQIGLSQECCLFCLKSSLWSSDLPCLLATTILDSFSLFYLPKVFSFASSTRKLILSWSPRSWILHMLFDLPLLLPHFLSHFNHICFLGFCNMLITKISSRFILASHMLFLTWCFTHISHFMCNTSAFSQANHFLGLSHFH